VGCLFRAVKARLLLHGLGLDVLRGLEEGDGGEEEEEEKGIHGEDTGQERQVGRDGD
jgi:hypothetical protein